MAKKTRKRTSGRKRSAKVDLATRKADQARGGAGAVAGILWAAMSSNDSVRPTESLRSKPGA